MLSHARVGRLHAAIGEILTKAIALEGSSFDAGYRTVLGLEGGFLAQNSVYGRENQPCRRCSRADHEDADRRTDRPADVLLSAVPGGAVRTSD